MLWCKSATGLKGPRCFVRFVNWFLGVRSVIARLVKEVPISLQLFYRRFLLFLKTWRKFDKKSFNFGVHSLRLQIQIKYFAIKKQKLICSSYLELSGLRPKAASASRDLESFSMILPDCSYENKLFQKDWVFSHVKKVSNCLHFQCQDTF